MAPVRVVLANDDVIIVEGLRAVLAQHPDRVEVVGTVTGDPQIEHTPDACPEADVLLLDTFGRQAQGVQAARMLLERDAPFRVVVFTDAVDVRFVLQALRLGVHGYLLKSAGADELVEDLEAVRDGRVVVDRSLATEAALLAARHADIGDWPGAHLELTRRESDVLVSLGRGLDPEATAATLGVSRETVRTHLRHIYRKLDVSDRAGAVAVAWREGLVA